ncbi:MAG: response regulator [bacterium]
MKKLAILYLEDIKTDVEIVESYLEEEKIEYELTNVDNRSDFISVLKKKQFDIIFLDYSLPSFDGLSALAIVKKSYPDIPAMMISGVMGEEQAIETIKAGATDYILKQHMSRFIPSLKRAIEEAEEQRKRKRAEEALRESEQKLLKAQQVARMGFLDVNLKTNEVYWSDEIYRLYGVNPQEQKASFELTKQIAHPDDLDFVTKGIDSAIQGISELDIDHRILISDGTVLWVHEQAELIRDADGNPDHMLGTVMDITKRKRAEQELIIANKELAFQNEEKEKRAAELIIANKELVFQNEEKEKRAAELVIANKELSFQNEEKEKRAAELIIANKELVFQNEEKEKRAAELTIANKELVFQNEERKQAEEKLRASNQQLLDQTQELSRMATVVIDSNDAITIQDLEGNITAWNAGATKTYGYSAQEAFKMNVTDLVPEELKAEALNFIVSLKKGELVTNFETKRQTKDDKILDVWMVVTKLVDENGKLIGAATTERDITERKRAEEEARKMHQSLVETHGKLQRAYEDEKHLREKLIQSEKLASLGQMGAKIAHEINNPLTVISGRAQLYLMEDLDERLKKTFELIIRETKRIENITSAYRNLSRPVLPKKELLDLNAVLEESVENLINTGEIKHYKIQRNFYPDLPQVIGDSNRLVQVFRNLIVNASHAMAGCEEKILTLRSAVSKDGKFAEISIQDTGSGIEKEKLDKIFEVYFTTKADELGTGLGLVVVKDIVEKQHKGKVSVESEPGKGTTFTIQLPLKTERKQQKILIVDDEAYIREFYMTFFEEKGLEVFTAVNGKEALDNYDKIQPDIVLSDIEMPVMNGFELAEKIRERKPEQKIIFMTGYYYEDSVKEQLKKANIPYFTKPADLNDVWKMVSEELKCGL